MPAVAMDAPSNNVAPTDVKRTSVDSKASGDGVRNRSQRSNKGAGAASKEPTNVGDMLAGPGAGKTPDPKTSRFQSRMTNDGGDVPKSNMPTASTTSSMFRGGGADSQRPSAVSRISQKKAPAGPTIGVRVASAIVENKYFVTITTLLTIYALTGDDCRLMWTNSPADKWFDVLTIACLVVFTVEIFLSVKGKEDYFMGFFFILDVISTATLILDLSAVATAMAGGGEDGDSLRSGRTARIGAKAGRIVRVIRLVRILKLYKALYEARQRQKAKQEAELRGEEPDDADWDEEDIEEQSKEKEKNNESRVGKKLSDMTTRRVIILVLTMLLVFPLLKADAVNQLTTSGWYGADNVLQNYEKFLKSPEALNNLTFSRADREATHSFQDYEHSLLNYVFYHNWYARRGYCEDREGSCANIYYSHLFWIGIMGPESEEADITKNANLAKITQASVDNYLSKRKAGDKEDMYSYGDAPPEATKLLTSAWHTKCPVVTKTGTKIRHGVSLISQTEVANGYPVSCPEDIRVGERGKFYSKMVTQDRWKSKWQIVYYFDLRPFVRTDAMFNLCVTGFICIVLCSAALLFTNDANKLVLNPVENMIKRVEAIRRDPLVAMKMADEEFKKELIAEQRAKRARLQCTDIAECKKMFARAGTEPMETVILEKTIIKLGSLLALGFGEAGAAIVSHNMKGGDSAGVNAMIPGRSVNCLLGLARIKNFSTANEVLKGSIMMFANQVAEIVHGVCNEYHGAPNKNNGDSFLLVWRMSEEDFDNGKHRLNEAMFTSRMAELACVSFSRVIGSLHHSKLLADYRVHPGLQQRLGSQTRVNMSFGLHSGWAIEGAVGSEFKIDASYLSPNVSICNGIEKATSIYGVPFIVAESVFEQLGKKMQDRLRLIDRVVLTGSTEPMKIFSMDLNVMSVEIGPMPMKIVWNPRQRFKARQYLESEKQHKLKEDLDTSTLFDLDPNIVAMRALYTVGFRENFAMGYQNYSQGEWPVARRMLITTQTMLGSDGNGPSIEDGPSTALLKYMEQHQFQAPKEWVPPGARDLNHTTGITSI